MDNQNLKPQKLFIITLIISFFVGGLTGGIAGILGSSYLSNYLPNSLPPMFQKIVKEVPVSDNSIKIEESSTIKAVKKISPSVVSIVITKDVTKYYQSPSSPEDFFNDDFFGGYGSPFRFYTPRVEQKTEKEEVGWGSGFIISQDGMVLTNKHVVSDEEAEYTIVTNDGEKYKAEILAVDPTNDIAIIKVEAKNLIPVELGDSDKLQAGQTVVAIGNALGEYRNTVTQGVISGIGRTIVAGDTLGRSETLENVIQTDAAINPGNSGGPLIDLNGKVIGINTAVSQSGQLIGFAIPVNEAKAVIENVKKYGRIVRPYLGVRYLIINEAIAKANNLSVNYGALIQRGQNAVDLAVIPGSPADKAGLLENDIILEVNGQKINEKRSLAKEISKYKPGDEIELKILSKGKEKKVKAKLEERK
ncbi:MAG: protease [Parcubacteria group bacterium Athens1014_10]|nr:MAG: protease [Parcubacteria group bacterium Athens1014_10]TSD06108.1 MAG: protease [Parcubacteria group bacterium Athens0714_12]